MPLNPVTLTAELAGIDTKGKTQEFIALEFANIITNYIKSAQIVGQGTGANGGGPITTVVTGSLQ